VASVGHAEWKDEGEQAEDGRSPRHLVGLHVLLRKRSEPRDDLAFIVSVLYQGTPDAAWQVKLSAFRLVEAPWSCGV